MGKVKTGEIEEHPRAVRARRCRSRFSKQSVLQLEYFYMMDPYPGITQREELASLLNVSESRIHVSLQFEILEQLICC